MSQVQKRAEFQWRRSLLRASQHKVNKRIRRAQGDRMRPPLPADVAQSKVPQRLLVQQLNCARETMVAISTMCSDHQVQQKEWTSPVLQLRPPAVWDGLGFPLAALTSSSKLFNTSLYGNFRNVIFFLFFFRKICVFSALSYKQMLSTRNWMNILHPTRSYFKKIKIAASISNFESFNLYI